MFELIRGRAVAIFLVVGLATSASSQTITFTRTLGGAQYDEGASIEQTPDGGYIICGTVTPCGTCATRIYLGKLSKEGNVVWEQTYQGTIFARGGYAHQASNGGYIVVGNTYPETTLGNERILVFLTDSLGNIKWSKQLYGDYGYSVQSTSDNGFAILGSVYGGPGVNDQTLLYKLDMYGNDVWGRSYHFAIGSQGTSLRETGDHGFVVTGFTQFSAPARSLIMLIKTNPTGDTLWTRFYGRDSANQQAYGYDVISQSDGGFIVSGTVLNPDGSGCGKYLMRADSHGNSVWTRVYGNEPVSDARRVQETIDGGYILGGSVVSPFDLISKMSLVKTNAAGDTLWTKTFGGAHNDYGVGVVQTSDSGYALVGTTESFGAGSGDIYVVKTDKDGGVGDPLPIQLSTFSGASTGGGSVKLSWGTVSETHNYGFYVERRKAGEQAFTTLPGSFIHGHGTTTVPQPYSFVDRSVTNGSWYYRLRQVDLDGSVHFNEAVQVEVLLAALPVSFSLDQNYPNPFNPTTTIRYALPARSYVTLSVFNTLGQQMATLVNDTQEAGYHEVRFDGASLASGVYFYRLKAGDFIQTRKLLLLE
ncbi:MAG TPA: T9SS type A sorting domain-containing protein [Bacteroidota bacterium]